MLLITFNQFAILNKNKCMTFIVQNKQNNAQNIQLC